MTFGNLVKWHRLRPSYNYFPVMDFSRQIIQLWWTFHLDLRQVICTPSPIWWLVHFLQARPAQQLPADAYSFLATGLDSLKTLLSPPLALLSSHAKGLTYSCGNWRPQPHPPHSVPGRHVLPRSPFRTEALILVVTRSVAC